MSAGSAFTPSVVRTFQRLHLRDERPNGTDGGTVTGGAWNTRTLNTTIINEIPGASVSANVITLPAGTYRVRGIFRVYVAAQNRLRLRQTSGTPADIDLGLCGYNDGSNAVEDSNTIETIFTSTATHTYEVQHWYASNGGGIGNMLGINDAAALGDEHYGEIIFERDISGTVFSSRGLLLHVREEQNYGTNGQSSNSAAAWVTRVVNTVITNEIGGASVASNQITLPAGTYFVNGKFVTRSCSTTNSRVATTGGTTLVTGINTSPNAADFSDVPTIFSGRFTLTATTTIEIQQFLNQGGGVTGTTQSGTNPGTQQVYLDAEFYKLD